MPRFSPLALAPFVLASALALVPCVRAAEGIPSFDHVIVVIMENHAYDTVRVLPYTAGLIAASSSFAYSYGVTHPSQPNYLALWAASTMGTVNDNCPAPGSPYSAENLGHACEAAGLTWTAYSEALPAVGSTACTASGTSYTRKHDPWTDFANLTHANEVPFTQFASDTAAGLLPNLAFIVPNNCDNTHDCTPATGDTWLSQNLPGIVQAAGPHGLVILTWDEDDSAHGNHILTVFAGPSVRAGYVSYRTITHYSVVRTVCAALGLPAFANAATDSAVTDVWNVYPTAAPLPSPAALRLDAPSPSPTRGTVRAVLHLPAPARVTATLYDATGRRVRLLLDGMRAGTVPLAWDGRDDAAHDAGSGVFFLRVRAGASESTRRFVRLR